MFTGLITDQGVLHSLTEGPVRRFEVLSSYPHDDLKLGASIAHNGVCLTLVEIHPDPKGSRFIVEVSPETLAVTTLGAWKVGDVINLERALKIGDELGGHIVQGHVDGVGEVVARQDQTGWIGFKVKAPAALSPFIAHKGSITVEGVSLTVNGIDGDVFDLMIIPHTAEVTTLGQLQSGMRVNLEVDVMARYAARLSQTAEH